MFRSRMSALRDGEEGGAAESGGDSMGHKLQVTANIEKTLEELMNFQWGRLDEYENRRAIEEAEEKVVKAAQQRVMLKAELDEQVRVRKERIEKEKKDEEIWKVINEQVLVKKAEDDAEDAAHKKYLNQREKRERDEQAAMVREKKELEVEEAKKQDLEIV